MGMHGTPVVCQPQCSEQHCLEFAEVDLELGMRVEGLYKYL